MKVNVVLADKGTNVPAAGTLNLLNAGWSRTFAIPQPQMPNAPRTMTPAHAVAVFYEVEPRRCNRPIPLVFELVTADGQTVSLPGPAGPQEMRLTQMITVQSPGASPPGWPGTGNSLLEIVPGLPLAPGVYEWRVHLDGEHQEDWSARFQVQATPGPPAVSMGTAPPPQ